MEDDLKCDDKYLEKEMLRIRKNVFKKSKHGSGFQNAGVMAKWWGNKIKEQCESCAYCKTPIRVIEKLISTGRLKGRRTRGIGMRGPFLELERVDSGTNKYAPENCALICYYCNNDKSNVYSREEYIEFLAPAKNKHFMHLFGSV